MQDLQTILRLLMGQQGQQQPFIPSIGRQGDFASPMPLTGRTGQFAQPNISPNRPRTDMFANPQMSPEHRDIDTQEILHYLRSMGFINR